MTPSTPSAPSAPPAIEMDEELTFPAHLYPSIGEETGVEIQCEFFHPPPYIPEDEFDLPPSYNDVFQENITATASGSGNMHLVATQ